MCNKFKGMIIGIIIGTIISATTTFALNGSVQKILEYRNIKIVVDGNKITPTDADGNYVEPFIIDGTTYLPVRAVADAFGKNVSWDGNTHTVYIGEKPDIAYMDAFAKNIQNVIDNYGKYVDKVYTGIHGLKYGTLVDFENDSVPELVLLHDMIVEVYRFDGEQSSKIYEERLGSRFMQTDVSYTMGINDTCAEPCLITYQSMDEWCSETLHVFTIKDGKPNIQVLYAEGKITDPNGGPTEEFINFKIDEESVSKENYMTLRNIIFDGEKEVDANWNYDFEMSDNYIYASEAELNSFLSEFGL